MVTVTDEAYKSISYAIKRYIEAPINNIYPTRKNEELEVFIQDVKSTYGDRIKIWKDSMDPDKVHVDHIMSFKFTTPFNNCISPTEIRKLIDHYMEKKDLHTL